MEGRQCFAGLREDLRTVLNRTPNPPQRHPPPPQPPPPHPQHDPHVQEIKHQRPAEDDRVQRPRSLLRQPDPRGDDGPGQDPEEVGSEGLVEVPAGAGGEEDGGELVLERVEDVTPVYVLFFCEGGGFC